MTYPSMPNDKVQEKTQEKAQEKIPISLAIITLNEEAHIARCIQSVPWASEVIVVDSGSQDKTVEIAKELGAQVYAQKFLGFGPQKQWALDKTNQDWVLSLDADEALSPELSQEIQKKWKEGFEAQGYFLPRLSYHMGRWIRHGGWHPDYQLRLFNKKFARWGGGHVHEKIICEKTKKLKHVIYHWVFRDLSHQVEANNRYSSLGAQDLKDRKKKFCLCKLLFKPISKFVECYFFKRGFLDGLPGFIIAVGASYSVFLKFSKLYESQIVKREGKS